MDHRVFLRVSESTMKRAVSVVAVVSTLFFVDIKARESGLPCLNGTECSNIPRAIVNTRGTNYCCKLEDSYPKTKEHPDGNVTCFCPTNPYEGLMTEERVRLWYTMNMPTGRACQYGQVACYGATMHQVTTIEDTLEFCCRSVQYGVRVVHTFNTTLEPAYERSGCLCYRASVPKRTPGAYVVPQTEGDYTSSGEDCYYNEDCNDYPALKCDGAQGGAFCCYRSRGMQTKNINATTTACTCTQDFLGTECELNPRPVPLVPEVPCLSNCSDATATDKCFAGDAERCCTPNYVISAKIVNDAFTVCTCRAKTLDITQSMCTSSVGRTTMMSLVFVFSLALASRLS